MTTALDNGLWKAADVLNESGFVKNKLSSGNKVCAIGAYGKAFGKALTSNGDVVSWAQREHADEMEVLVDTIKTLFPDRSLGSGNNAAKVTAFNDHTATTKEDVAKVFRVAAVKLAAGV